MDSCCLLEYNYGLIIGDFESAPAAWIRAGEEIIHPHQVIPGFGELGPVQFVGAWR